MPRLPPVTRTVLPSIVMLSSDLGGSRLHSPRSQVEIRAHREIQRSDGSGPRFAPALDFGRSADLCLHVTNPSPTPRAVAAARMAAVSNRENDLLDAAR